MSEERTYRVTATLEVSMEFEAEREEAALGLAEGYLRELSAGEEPDVGDLEIDWVGLNAVKPA